MTRFRTALTDPRSFRIVLALALAISIGAIPLIAACDPAYCDYYQGYSQACNKWNGAKQDYQVTRCSWECYYGGLDCKCFVIVCGRSGSPCSPSGSDIYRHV
jgi:hypothetical protein